MLTKVLNESTCYCLFFQLCQLLAARQDLQTSDLSDSDFSVPEPKAEEELIGWALVRCPSSSSTLSTFLNHIFSEKPLGRRRPYFISSI